MLVYLDQNYASRIAKYLLGQRSHQAHGLLYQSLLRAQVIAPPSPFHVLEACASLRESSQAAYPARERIAGKPGYLVPTLKTLFQTLSRGFWVRPWEEVLMRQLKNNGHLLREDLLGKRGSWDAPADLSGLEGITELELKGSFLQCTWQAQATIVERLGLPKSAEHLPFVQILARLLAFRATDTTRQPQPSDLTDLVIAATVRPYVDGLATDRYVKEALGRVGYGQGVYGGREQEVLRLARDLSSLGWA